MVLDAERIRKELQSPSRKGAIDKAITHQNWIRFHAETQFDNMNGGLPLSNLMGIMKQQLPEDKYRNAVNLLRFPLPSYDVVDSIFNSLAEIFSGRNPVFAYQFKNVSDLEDWEYYRKSRLNEPNVWSTTAWDWFRTEINSIVVVDLPAVDNDPEDSKVKPYFYFVPISAVKSYGMDYKGNLEWVMFLNAEGNLTVIDGGSYRTYRIEKDGTLGRKLSDNPHDLAYCPANFFWRDSISITEKDVKKSPLTKALSKLDWFVFSDINKRNLDIASSYPIYWGYEEECDYEDGNGNVCDHGVMKNAEGKVVIDPITQTVVMCPRCSKHRITGPGSFVKVPIPEEGQPDLRDPIGMLGVDRKSLDYNVEDLERQKEDIRNSCIGKDSDIVQEASLADKQIDATYEKRTAVLENVKKNFEAIQEFVDRTCCRLRYGDSFIGCHINYGTSFFTMTVDALRKQYADAKESGASQTELMALREQILQTQYRNNPQMLERLRILDQVEPYPVLSRNDVLNLWEKGVADTVELELKENFASYISRFERENGNITEFGLLMKHTERVNKITETIKKYADESVKSRQSREVQGTEGNGTSLSRRAGEGEVQ